MTMRAPGDASAEERLAMRRWQQAGCLPPDLLLAARGEVLPEGVQQAVDAHLEVCPLCVELANAMSAGADLTAGEAARIEARVRAARRGSWRTWITSAAAAVILTVAGATYFVNVLSRSTSPAVSPPSASAPSEPGPSPLPLAPPAILLPPESLTLRSGGKPPYAAALDAALEPFAAGDYQAAGARLAGVARDYPDRPHGHFYLGTARLLSGDAAGAIGPLEQAAGLDQAGISLRREAAWYLAIALERTGRREEAVMHLARLCGADTPRREEACTGLKQLLTR
jgi:hypothetical protein